MAKTEASRFLYHPKEKLKTFQVCQDDIYSITFPKSGTHWLKHIIRLILNDGELVPEETRGGHLEFIVAEEDDHPSVFAFKRFGHPDMCADIETMKSPRYFVTHMPIDWLPRQLFEKKPKIIYLARNPKDVLVSLVAMLRLRHNRESSTGSFDHQIFQSRFEMFLSEKPVAEHGRWHEHVLTWWHRRNEDNVLFIKYEDMKRDLTCFVDKIAAFIGKDLPSPVIDKIVHLTSFEVMRQTHFPEGDIENKALQLNIEDGKKPFIRKGVIGGWKDHFTVAQNEYFDQNYKKWMEGSGLDFDFE
ncbi:sulfotransferase 1C4-like [Glandiceps talaboti]